jgi:uncharacterized protein (TIGR02117 family)
MHQLKWVMLIALMCYLFTGCTNMPNAQKIPIVRTEHVIYFIYRDWHTSILLDAETAARYSQHLRQDAERQGYIRIGWGDGDYFTGKSKTFGSATKALIASSHSALQVIAYAQPPFTAIPAETRVPIAISDKGMRRLLRYIDESFALDDAGVVIPLIAYAADAGSFYQASGHYSLLSNCNTWSGRALQAAELPVRSNLQLTAQSVFEQAKYISQYQQALGLLEKSE